MCLFVIVRVHHILNNKRCIFYIVSAIYREREREKDTHAHSHCSAEPLFADHVISSKSEVAKQKVKVKSCEHLSVSGVFFLCVYVFFFSYDSFSFFFCLSACACVRGARASAKAVTCR